ncbi:hypothetical protein UFOVP844_36 [uncultured Caudovirales phage]|uniref:Uncharacterized protein n=1 Tax=uncultured Caudovirales phage TaxID=2100421 RepID=A0A6J5P409_9CAUD|nr:hypothetical protein UFOVP844_36 [uncultured Caudovirales phage]
MTDKSNLKADERWKNDPHRDQKKFLMKFLFLFGLQLEERNFTEIQLEELYDFVDKSHAFFKEKE